MSSDAHDSAAAEAARRLDRADRSGPTPWYVAGLRFECLGCGRCCTGEPGYVWIDGNELKMLADYLAMDPGELEASYVRRVGRRRSLIEMPNGDCVFFDSQTRRCLVYPVRPKQCRSWPFWPSNLRSPDHWEQACQQCHGCGRGKLFPVEEIELITSLKRV